MYEISMGKNEIVMYVHVHMCVVIRAQPLVSFLLRSRPTCLRHGLSLGPVLTE